MNNSEIIRRLRYDRVRPDNDTEISKTTPVSEVFSTFVQFGRFLNTETSTVPDDRRCKVPNIDKR